MVDQLKIGDKIKKARGDAGLTQKELGKKIGITAMGISYLEKGLRKIKVDDIVKIAEQLNVEKSYLLEPITGKPIGNNGSSSTPVIMPLLSSSATTSSLSPSLKK